MQEKTGAANGVFMAKQRLRSVLRLLQGDPGDEAIARALQGSVELVEVLAGVVDNLDAARSAEERVKVARAGASLTDVLGRRRSPATLPGYNKGRVPRNKGKRYPPTPPSVEEIVRMLAACGNGPYGMRMRSLLLVLWRSGLRISEALDLTESDLNRDDSSVMVLRGKGGKQRLVGIDSWVWPQLDPWLEFRRTLPFGPLFCVIEGPTAGARWSTSAIRRKLPELAAAAGVRRRVAPHQFRHALAVQMLEEDVNVLLISRQLGHGNLGITTAYFAGLPQSKVVEAVRSRPVPQINALSSLTPSALAPSEVTHV